MLLIPLVENCLKHCDLDNNEETYILIKVRVKKGQIYFYTENTYQPTKTEKAGDGGVGLVNVRKRLDLHYHSYTFDQNNYHLETKKQTNTFVVELSIDQLKTA